MRGIAIFFNGSLNVFALRRTAKAVRFRALAIVSTLFALRMSFEVIDWLEDQATLPFEE